MKEYHRPENKILPEDKSIGKKSHKKEKPYILECRQMKTITFVDHKMIEIDPGIWSDWTACGRYFKERDLDNAYNKAIQQLSLEKNHYFWRSEREYRKVIKNK